MRRKEVREMRELGYRRVYTVDGSQGMTADDVILVARGSEQHQGELARLCVAITRQVHRFVIVTGNPAGRMLTAILEGQAQINVEAERLRQNKLIRLPMSPEENVELATAQWITDDDCSSLDLQSSASSIISTDPGPSSGVSSGESLISPYDDPK
jgi:hypothetical protein